MEQAMRCMLVKFLCAENLPAKLWRLLKILKRMTCHIAAQFKIEVTFKRRPHKQWNDWRCMSSFVNGLKNLIRAKPETPMFMLTKKQEVNQLTISRCVKNALGIKSYVIKIRHLLTKTQKESREECRKGEFLTFGTPNLAPQQF